MDPNEKVINMARYGKKFTRGRTKVCYKYDRNNRKTLVYANTKKPVSKAFKSKSKRRYVSGRRNGYRRRRY